MGRRRRLVRPVHETPHAKLTHLQTEVRDLIEDLVSSIRQMNEVTSAGGHPLIRDEGWAADDLIASLTDVQGQLHFWKHTATMNANNSSGRDPEDLAVDEELDDADDLDD